MDGENKHFLRGFSAAEYKARAAALQRQMDAARLDAVLLTAAADIEYFSGFQTRFWQSPTRPWFLAVPANGAPVAVIPEIGREVMQQTWLADIRCWPSPRPQDEGISLLAELFAEWRCARLGMALGAESAQRMPVLDFLKLRAVLQKQNGDIADCAAVLQQLRMVKSPAEIAHMRQSAKIVSAAFAALPEDSAGLTEREICARLQARILQNGADEVPYLAAASGNNGYPSVIMPPKDKIPQQGEILMIDIGAVLGGYFCDFNRNFCIGAPNAAVQKAHAALQRAVRAGIAAARPGVAAKEVWAAMRAKLPNAGNVGRMGHGIGLLLTEPPSFTAEDETILQAGMVLAVEPGMQTEGGVLVCEENIAISATGEAEILTVPAGEELPVIGVK